MPALVESPAQAIENIRRYQTEIKRGTRLSETLVERMTNVRRWYAFKTDDGTWLFGPSKFVGYVGLTAETYVQMSAKGYEPAIDRLHGWKTEACLAHWFERPPDRIAELEDALRRFIVDEHKRPRPNAAAKILVLQDAYTHFAEPQHAREIGDRICIEQTICGGRPHIRGTRVRVSDILSMLAEGLSQQQILVDYPYLTAEDLKAALAFGAAASEHRIVLAA